MCVQARKAGAIGFLLKPFRDQELVQAVDLSLARDLLIGKTKRRWLRSGSASKR
jgi:FixJ family two-component response regulator